MKAEPARTPAVPPPATAVKFEWRRLRAVSAASAALQRSEVARGRTHHTKADVEAPVERLVPDTVGRSRVDPIAEPGPAAQRTGIGIIGTGTPLLRRFDLVQAPLPHRARHVQDTRRGGAGRVHPDGRCLPQPALKGIGPPGLLFGVPLGAPGKDICLRRRRWPPAATPTRPADALRSISAGSASGRTPSRRTSSRRAPDGCRSARTHTYCHLRITIEIVAPPPPIAPAVLGFDKGTVLRRR